MSEREVLDRNRVLDRETVHKLLGDLVHTPDSEVSVFRTDDENRFLAHDAAQRAEIKRYREALEEIAGNEWYASGGGGFCHPEGCDSPGIAHRALNDGADDGS